MNPQIMSKTYYSSHSKDTVIVPPNPTMRELVGPSSIGRSVGALGPRSHSEGGRARPSGPTMRELVGPPPDLTVREVVGPPPRSHSE